PEHGDAEFLEFVQENIDQARDQGATSAQLAILEQVTEFGEIPLEDLRIAVRNAVDCMVTSGVVVEYVEETDNTGIIRPNFRAQIPDGEPAIEELIWECEVAESMWVAKLYALQPSSQSATDEYVDSRLP